MPEELEPAASRRNRGRLGIGRNEVTVNVGPITVQSGSADPREVAEEVADEIERRVRDRSLGLRDVLLADPDARSGVLMQMQVGTFRFEVAAGGAGIPGAAAAGAPALGHARPLRPSRPSSRISAATPTGSTCAAACGWTRRPTSRRWRICARSLGSSPARSRRLFRFFWAAERGRAGSIWGCGPVTRLEETERSLRENGVPIRIDFRVSLLEEGVA